MIIWILALGFIMCALGAGIYHLSRGRRRSNRIRSLGLVITMKEVEESTSVIRRIYVCDSFGFGEEYWVSYSGAIDIDHEKLILSNCKLIMPRPSREQVDWLSSRLEVVHKAWMSSRHSMKV
jgi:hypothetical protein